MSARASKQLSRDIREYEALLARRSERPLTKDEEWRLDELRDGLLRAAGALESHDAAAPRKSPRARLGLRVSFGSAEDAARAWTRDVGTGGVALATSAPLARGVRVQVALDVPGAPEPIRALGEVAWATEDAMGLAFVELSPDDARRLKALVSENTSFIQRLRRGKEGAASVRAEVALKAPVLVALSDSGLAGLLSGSLRATSFLEVHPPLGEVRPVAVVADASTVRAASDAAPGAPVILVDASHADAVAARVSGMLVTASIARPATLEQILGALEHLVED